MSAARVLSLNVGRSVPSEHTSAPGGTTGIDKYAVSSLTVRAPGPRVGGLGSGVVGDHIGDPRHHGGDDHAVYLFAREELDWWEGELGRSLRSGMFGENVTTAGLDVDGLVVGTLLQVGPSTLRVAGPRTPCRTFAGHMGERGWVRRFTEHGLTGAYCSVEVPGEIRPDDPITVVSAPDHGITVPQLFRALMGDPEQAQRVVAAGAVGEPHLSKLAQSVARRTGAQPA